MLFDSVIQEAKGKFLEIEYELEKAKSIEARLEKRLKKASRKWNDFYRQGIPQYKWLFKNYKKAEEIVYKRITQSQRTSIERIQRKLENVRKKIKALQDAKDDLELWILEKEDAWKKVSPDVLKAQIHEIVSAVRELSKFILGREVDFEFLMEDDAPLGFAPVKLKKKKIQSNKIFLSVKFLEEQPQYLLDYYKALIIHECGHILLHFNRTNRNYRILRKIIEKKMRVDPNFHELLNVLLDEQLERVLRDVKKDWQAWFNRLSFYDRRISVKDLQNVLNKGRKDGTADGKPKPWHYFMDRKYFKLFQDPAHPFVVILSAKFLRETLGFNRFFAFFYTLRCGLPRQTVSEPWLKDCLDFIPKNFTSLDLMDTHKLALKIYERIMEGKTANHFSTLYLRKPDGTLVEVLVPGKWKKKEDEGFVALGKEVRDKHSYVVIAEKLRRSSRVEFPPDPEGEPPPPARIDDEETRHVKKKKKKKNEKKEIYGVTGNSNVVPADYRNSPAWADLFGTREEKLDDGDGRNAVSLQEKLKQKLRSGRLSAKEKTRLMKEIEKQKKQEERKKEQQKKREEEQRKKQKEQGRREQEQASKKPEPPIQMEPEEHISIKSPSWTQENASKNLEESLNQVLEQVKKEMEEKQAGAVKLDRMTAESASPSDYKNTDDTLEFPAAESIKELKPDRMKNREALLQIKRFVPVLRPFITFYDQERELHERLYSGKRLLGSGIKKYALYGEKRIFKDMRFESVQDFSDVHVTVLIDTSASMAEDGRLEGAKRLAALLAECFKECENIETAFIGFNQNIYLCGNHEEYSFTSLQPSGKTNVAAALDYVRQKFVSLPRRLKIVISYSDSLQTACSGKSIQHLIDIMEKKHGFRFILFQVMYGLFPDHASAVYLGKCLGKVFAREITDTDFARKMSRWDVMYPDLMRS